MARIARGKPWTETAKRWAPAVAWAALGAYFCLRRGAYTFLDTADLIIHEAGHFFLTPFGELFHMLGGTLMQVALPGLLVWHFLCHEYRFGVQASLFWLGHNFLNISVYAADAQAQRLPLLGGGRHDWHYLLGRFGLLEYDAAVGYGFVALAVLCLALILATPALVPDYDGDG